MRNIASKREVGFGVGAGFTIAEVIVTVLIVAVLAVMVAPQYIKVVESSRAEAALSVVRAIATANRLYSLEKSVLGGPPAYAHLDGPEGCAGTLCNACNASAAACPDTGNGTICNLITCNLLPRRDWDNAAKNWKFMTRDGNSPTTTPCVSVDPFPNKAYIACAWRVAATGPAISSGWFYAVDINGKVEIPTSGAGATTPRPAVQ